MVGCTVCPCVDDQVYMGDHELCKQYVLSDVGNIFYGNEHEISTRPWNYGQVLARPGSNGDQWGGRPMTGGGRVPL